MNSEFEVKLVEQPLRATPAAWRAEILRDARDAAVQQSQQRPAVTGWRSWFWPAPQAWVALSACWLVLLAVNFIDRPTANVANAQSNPARLALALAEKRRLFLELEMAVAVQPAQPAVPRLPQGASGWIRDEKEALPC